MGSAAECTSGPFCLMDSCYAIAAEMHTSTRKEDVHEAKSFWRSRKSDILSMCSFKHAETDHHLSQSYYSYTWHLTECQCDQHLMQGARAPVPLPFVVSQTWSRFARSDICSHIEQQCRHVTYRYAIKCVLLNDLT